MQTPSDVAFQSPLSAFSQVALQGLTQLTQAFNTLQDIKGKKEKLPFEIEGLNIANTLASSQNELEQAQKAGQLISNDTQRELLKWIPVEKSQNFMAKSLEIVNLGLQGKLTRQQVRNLVAQEFNINADTDRLKALTANIEQDTALKSAQTDMAKLDYASKKKIVEKILDSYIKQLEFGLELESIINEGGVNYFKGLTDPYDWKNPRKPYMHNNLSNYLRHKYGAGKRGKMGFDALGFEYSTEFSY